MDNVQKDNILINIPPSQNFRSDIPSSFIFADVEENLDLYDPQ
jgi:hypothetical protein